MRIKKAINEFSRKRARHVREKPSASRPEAPVDLRIDTVGLVACQIQKSFVAEYDVRRWLLIAPRFDRNKMFAAE